MMVSQNVMLVTPNSQIRITETPSVWILYPHNTHTKLTKKCQYLKIREIETSQLKWDVQKHLMPIKESGSV